jgi:hypothetical protein
MAANGARLARHMETLLMKKLFLVIVALCALPAIASADETLKWRHVQYTGSIQSQPVPDVAGHTLNVYRLPGLATFSDGTIGKTAVIGSSDTVNGGGTARGYNIVTTSDGSELHLSYVGEVQTSGARKGTFTVIGGKGRFAGAQGTGTWEGGGLLVAANEALSYIDCVINIKTAVAGK